MRKKAYNSFLASNKMGLAECATTQLDLFDHNVIEHDVTAIRLCTRRAPKARCMVSTSPQAWHEYNLAQTTEKSRFQELLYNLCNGIEEPVQTMGRPRIPLADMLFAVVLKVYCGFSGRRTTSDLMEALRRGYLSRSPHFNSLSNYMEAEWLTPYLHALITQSSLPLKTIERDFAVDSSGFSTSTYARWVTVKWGGVKVPYESVTAKDYKKQNWVKLHLMCGVKTNIVTSCIVTDKDSGDSPQFKGLVDATAENFVMSEVSADKAYSSRANLKLVQSHAAMPYIDFKETSKANPKDDTWTRLYHFYAYNKEWFYQHYHKRSNVETVFSMIKAKFGGNLRSKTYQAQMNEALCKVLCHNVCCLIQSIYELGIEPTFWTE
jgi:transposase